MEVSKPAIVTPPQNLMTARSVDDPFFANANHQLSDKGFLVASADSLIAWARTGSLMWMQFGLACCAIEMMQMSMPRCDEALLYGVLLLQKKIRLTATIER